MCGGVGVDFGVYVGACVCGCVCVSVCFKKFSCLWIPPTFGDFETGTENDKTTNTCRDFPDTIIPYTS